MKAIDAPVINVHTLRRDLYLLASLLLADKQLAETKMLDTWMFTHYETEVNRLAVWLATAMRGLLDLQGAPARRGVGAENCGEYCGDFPAGKTRALSFRQACNSMIHAKQIWPYKFSQAELGKPAAVAQGAGRRTHDGIVSIRGVHHGLQTRADVDIIAFIESADRLIRLHEEEKHHADR